MPALRCRHGREHGGPWEFGAVPGHGARREQPVSGVAFVHAERAVRQPMEAREQAEGRAGGRPAGHLTAIKKEMLSGSGNREDLDRTGVATEGAACTQLFATATHSIDASIEKRCHNYLGNFFIRGTFFLCHLISSFLLRSLISA